MSQKTKVRKTNIHNIFATDQRKEEEGAWVEVNALYGLSVKVRRMRSDTAVKAYEKLIRETLGEGKLRTPEDISSEQSMTVFKRHLAENILCDWQNLRDAESGDVIPYTSDMARELLEIKDFREFVVQAANERDTYRESADKDAEGNS